MSSRHIVAAILASLLMSGCATSYGPNGLTGGYKDEQIDEHTYVVKFLGNGHTSGDAVWNYWIYRCAELTKGKGFSAFTLSPIDRKVSALIPEYRQSHMNLAESGEASFIPTKGGGGGSYYYVPGQTITTYSAGATVTMYKLPYPRQVKFLLEPQVILDALKPYIDSGAKIPAPNRKELLDKAIIPPSIYL